MTKHLMIRWLFALLLTLRSGPFAYSADDNALAKESSWSLPSVAEVRARLAEWETATQRTAEEKAKIAPHWPAADEKVPQQEVLDRIVRSFAAVDAKAKEIVDFCTPERASQNPPTFPYLQDAATASFVRHNLRLFLARHLVQRDLADEALEQLAGISATDVVDPATLFFCRALAHHRLLQKDECLAAAEKLLEREADLPLRYTRLAHLMAADIKPLKKDSLDEISRLMEDVRRRLDHARAGKKVRDEEEEIIAKLDKMIEEKEKQRQQQQQQQQGNKGTPSPSKPADDSKPAGDVKGPGEVDLKNLGKKAGWGNLPAKDREEVIQQIGRELPTHFRDTIIEYFQRLGQDGVK